MTVSRTVGTYCGGVEPFDDMAALVLFLTELPGKEEMRLLPVALSSFGAVKEAVFSQAGDTPMVKKVLLACDEALSNIVQYSEATQLYFHCVRQGETLRVVFADNGTPFDPKAAAAEIKPFEELDSGGMGLNLIRQTASSTQYERSGGLNVFTMNFSLS